MVKSCPIWPARTFAAHLDFLKARFRFLPSRESPAPSALTQSTFGGSTAHHEKLALFLRKVFIDHMESGKRDYCFGKSLEEVLNFASKNLYEPYV